MSDKYCEVQVLGRRSCCEINPERLKACFGLTSLGEGDGQQCHTQRYVIGRLIRKLSLIKR